MVTFDKLGRYGRAGNQLFQIASTIGIATRFGYEYGFPEWVNWDASERFASQEDIQLQKYFKNPLPRYNGSLSEYFIHWGYHDINIPDNVSLSGHMQSEKYFKHCESTIRHYFEFNTPMSKMDYTAIHVRMGDYGSDYHPVCSQRYYAKAMLHTGGPYLVFSDEPDKAAKLLGFNPNVTVSDCTDTIECLRLMTACKRHIIANSTYSWWGAWLAQSEVVVAPEIWFGPAASHLDTRDIIPDNWLKL